MKRIAVLLASVLLLGLLTACGSAEQKAAQPEEETGPTQAGIWVEKVEDLPEDFLLGADVSTLLAQEASGVRYYDFDGKEQDLMKILADSGVNCVRVRLWVDPYDSQGRGYGGGNCDLDTVIELGRRAQENGMGLLVDFHYSDFWADPGKQMAPKGWKGLSPEEKAEQIYAYTTESLQKMKDAGVTPRMVQIGNEINNGLSGEKSTLNVNNLLASASRAVRDFDPGILIAVHYTNPESANYSNIAYKLATSGVDYDVFATSYYPFWHGTLENLREQLSTVAEKYGKRVMVAETSWPYTAEDSDGSGNSIGEGGVYAKPYPFTVQGQARELADVARTVASVGEAGLGVFYWEPAWIAVPGDSWEERSAKWEQFGSGWASSFAGEYDPDDAGRYYGGSSWDNQALFDPQGRPLESLLTFRYLRTGAETELKVDSIEPVFLTAKRNQPFTLPETIPAVMNDGSETQVEVNWDASVDPDELASRAVGKYELSGEAGGQTVKCTVDVVDENLLSDFSFEEQNTDVWTITELSAGPQTDFQVKAMDAFSGETSLHFWHANAVEFTVEQTVTGLAPGKYRASLQAQGGDVGEDAVLYLYVISDGERYEQSFQLNGWVNWANPVLEEIPCQNGEITVGAYIKTAGGGWGTLDDFLLNPVG